MIRFPFEPLARYANVPIHYDKHLEPTRCDYARAFNTTPTTIDRWREVGIPIHRADHIAIKILGVHPALIWPEWFDSSAA